MLHVYTGVPIFVLAQKSEIDGRSKCRKHFDIRVRSCRCRLSRRETDMCDGWASEDARTVFACTNGSHLVWTLYRAKQRLYYMQ
jgi:hypothetical protein